MRRKKSTESRIHVVFVQDSCLRFTDNVTKDGDAIKYTINVRKLHEAGDILTFVREYEDLQVHNLQKKYPIGSTSEVPNLVHFDFKADDSSFF